ncbi:hypothetical protein LEP1GSC161_0857 [Leptospira santarosai str. CBC1416]|uniref:Uncharacterized protein n=1 Tax=Leptospira santarosai str. CBC1416 TaxID=1193059 RepID=M6VVQ3_9LEPT|nr:hypothetical protein LEP1GSC161_0857 [Leptospira santarosai str. CBC1416]
MALCKAKMSDRTQRTPFYESAFRERDSQKPRSESGWLFAKQR